MTVMKRWAAIWVSILVLGATSGCVYYVDDDDGAVNGGTDEGAYPPPPPPPSELPPPPPPPPPDSDLCTGLAAAPAITDCNTDAGYEVDSWRTDSAFETALHLVSVYETRSDRSAGDHPEGEAYVEFSLPGSNVLALSAYEPTHWTVDVAPDAALEKIVVIGYHTQRVTAPQGVVVEIHDYESTGSPLAGCGYSLPYNGDGCDTNALIASVEELTGLPLAGFDGCYDATSVRLASSSECTLPPPPSTSGVIQDCAYGASTWRAEERGEPTLYLAGLYETRSDHSAGNHPEGEADVTFTLPGSNVLALSAYEPTHWTVDVALGAALDKIVAVGYHAQRVTAPPGVAVEIYDFGSTDSPLTPCGYSLPYDGQGCDTDALIADVEAVTGLTVSAFDGCYRATALVY